MAQDTAGTADGSGVGGQCFCLIKDPEGCGLHESIQLILLVLTLLSSKEKSRLFQSGTTTDNFDTRSAPYPA